MLLEIFLISGGERVLLGNQSDTVAIQIILDRLIDSWILISKLMLSIGLAIFS